MADSKSISQRGGTALAAQRARQAARRRWVLITLAVAAVAAVAAAAALLGLAGLPRGSSRAALDPDTFLPDPPPPQTVAPDPARPMRFFFGNLHSHSLISDGQGTPDEAYDWARHQAGYDFYGITDHAEQISAAEWEALGRSAAAKDVPGTFVALRGFEWSNYHFGHVCVYGTDSFVDARRLGDPNAFYAWLEASGGLAQLNHPGRHGNAFQSLAFKAAVRDNIFALETGNKGVGNAQGRYLAYFPLALQRGWQVAPTSNQDNHQLRTTSHRTAIIAPELTRAALLEAMRARRLYSTDDPNLKLTFKYGPHWMGATVVQPQRQVTFEIAVEDDEPIVRVELCDRQGKVLRSVDGQRRHSLQTTLTATVADWESFYLKVYEQDTKNDDPEQTVQLAVSAPIWIFVRPQGAGAGSGAKKAPDGLRREAPRR